MSKREEPVVSNASLILGGIAPFAHISDFPLLAQMEFSFLRLKGYSGPSILHKIQRILSIQDKNLLFEPNHELLEIGAESTFPVKFPKALLS